MQKISKSDLLRLYLRSFFIQTGWSYERMIAFGFVWALSPLTKKLFSSGEERADFLKRQLLNFNANPYLAGYSLGAVARLEEERIPGQQITRFKDSLRGPLGALGDRLIWQSFLPASLTLGIILTYRFGVWGALSFWLIFNLYQVYQRARGLTKGYSLGLGVSSDLVGGHIQKVTRWSGRIGAFLLGLLFAGKLYHAAIRPSQPGNAILLPLFILLSYAAFKKNLNPRYALLLLIALFLVIKAMAFLI
jgi:mannose/fructose/N-acetylgalactosamine-specific phosphotransferase system component IID